MLTIRKSLYRTFSNNINRSKWSTIFEEKIFVFGFSSSFPSGKMMQPSSSNYCIHCYNIKILKIFDPELQLINTKLIIKSKLKELLDHKKRNNCKIFHSSAKLIGNNSDIDVTFESMNQSFMTKIKKFC